MGGQLAFISTSKLDLLSSLQITRNSLQYGHQQPNEHLSVYCMLYLPLGCICEISHELAS